MKLRIFFAGLLILFFAINNINAQWLNCNSNLYKDKLFTPKLTDTVKFGENYTPGNILKELSMHVFVPEEDTSSFRPVLVLAFGGAYIRGQKEDVAPICEDFASRGYVCFAIDYRLFDVIKFPDSTDILDIGLKARADMIAAIKYIRWDADHNNSWRINPEFIFVGGASSGAITAMSTAYFNEKDSVDMQTWMIPILNDNGGFEGNSSFDFVKNYNYKVSGIANMLGAVVDLDYVDKGEPIIVGIHGTKDDVVPYGAGQINILNIPVFNLSGSSLVHERAIEQNIHSSFISVEGGKHGDFLKNENLPWLDSMINTTLNDFYNLVLCPDILDLEDFNDIVSLRISPNPASTFIKLESDLFDENMDIYVEIYSIEGKQISKPVKLSADLLLNTSNLNSGIYILRIKESSNRIISSKVFVIK